MCRHCYRSIARYPPTVKCDGRMVCKKNAKARRSVDNEIRE